MALTKNGINGIGALTLGAALVVGGLFVAKPQFTSASEIRAETSEIADNQTAQETKLITLKKEKENLPALQEELKGLQEEIPSTSEIDSIARVVVNQLNGVELVSFSHYPLMNFTPVSEPVVQLEAPEAPTASLKTPAEAGSTKPATGPLTLQMLPISIVVTAKSNEAIVSYMDRLAAGPRRILVQSVQTASLGTEETGSQITATIYAYAFANAPGQAAEATPSPSTEETE